MKLLTLFGWPKKNATQVVSKNWDDRTMILHENINLFCWRRPIDQEISNYLVKVISYNPAQLIQQITVGQIENQLKSAFEEWNMIHNEGHQEFLKDIINLANGFLVCSGSKCGTLHLKIVENDACTKFHVDGYKLRLFTTYLGRGTQWLPDDAVNRRALGSTNEKIIKDQSKIVEMLPFEVGILKGEVTSTSQKYGGIVHRSPKLSSNVEKRVILRIDI